MIKSDKMISVVNRSSGTVIYNIPDMRVRREFHQGEIKEVSYGELRAVAQQPGGRRLLYDYLLIRDRDAAKELMNVDLQQEVEYNMTAVEVRGWLNTCSLDAFKDALDFAPAGVKDLIKRYAVELPLNDVAKREALKEQLGFNVDAAIAIQKETKEEKEQRGVPAEEAPTQRRVKIIKAKEV